MKSLLPVNVKKAGVKTKKVVVTVKQAKIKQNLGNGFTRYVFTRTITPNTFFAFTLIATPEKIVSNGFWISGNLSQIAYPTSFYSQTPTRGITVVYNPTVFTRTIQFFFVTKT